MPKVRHQHAHREANRPIGNGAVVGYDLINTFNAWKKSEEAGTAFVVAADGSICKQVTGLAWRHKISARVFEEAAVDLGRALACDL
jgi:putative transposase